MREYLTRKAADDLLSIALKSYFYGLIDSTIFLERLQMIVQLSKKEAPAYVYSNHILSENDWPRDEWELGERETESLHDTSSGRSNIPSDGESLSDDDHDDPFVVTFVSSVVLKDWHFHQYDDDFFPSIPHGHWHKKRAPKLDPYLGWVYVGSRQIRRESRREIIALWNDLKFRRVAENAIDYYLTTHPHYNGWRVQNPRRLPKKRK